MLICLGWQGYLSSYIGKLVDVLNYRPIELTVKLRAMIKKEAGSIGPYDLMFFSEVTKDLSKLLEEKDKQIAQSEMHSATGAAAEGSSEAPGEEEKAQEKKPDVKAMTPAQMQAALMKKMAEAKKAKKGPAGKGAAGAKGAGKKEPPKPAQAPKADPKPAAEVIDKDTRKRMDTNQLLSFCDQLQAIKSLQVQTVWEILRCVNQIKEVNILNYQDLTL
jgi:hypothetical protein